MGPRMRTIEEGLGDPVLVTHAAARVAEGVLGPFLASGNENPCRAECAKPEFAWRHCSREVYFVSETGSQFLKVEDVP